MQTSDLAKITQALMTFGNTVPASALFPTVAPGAAEIITSNPYAFCIATCLDRGTKADIIWTIPYDIQNDLGHLDPKRIYKMSIEELTGMFGRLKRRPRYVNDAPRTIRDLTRIVVEECDGDASRIWAGKRASQVKRTLQSIHGVGSGIASMGLLLIEKAFSVRFPDRENMDIKPYVHTTRVLYRLGISTNMTVESALEASRRMNPAFPGKVDGALWEIGRNWCRPTNPDCPTCPVTSVCEKRLDGVPLQQSGLPSQSSNISKRQENKKKIVLISCVSQKLPYRSKAKDLYISPLFKKNLAYAHRLNPDAIYVLSAKYGLVNLETEIDPYNLTLNTLSAGEIKAWADNVLRQLSQMTDVHNDYFIFLAGMKYRKYLIPSMSSYEVPMDGLTIGKQLGFLSKQGGITNKASISNIQDNIMVGENKSAMAGKYSLLGKYLSALPIGQREITLTFSHIEQVLNAKLPPSAWRYRAWWSNGRNDSHVHARAWLDAGWFVDTVDFSRKQVRLARMRSK